MKQFPFNQIADPKNGEHVKVWFAHTCKHRWVAVNSESTKTLNRLAVFDGVYHASIESDYHALWKYIIRDQYGYAAGEHPEVA
jgi:hypothetical protein